MGDESNSLEASSSLIYRLNDDGSGPEVLKEVFNEKGWTEYDEEVHNDLQWNVWWKTSRFKTSDYNQLHSWQRVNHCPKTTGITRKDCLARLLKLQQALHGSAYNFAPLSFILPNDYRKFTQECIRLADKGSKGSCWICKPADMSRGRGISIIRELSELQYDTNTIVQQYITSPFLIHGYKFDIRLYAVVTSYHPLIVHLYNDGIARFSCEKYDLSSLGNIYAHLTNTSINKHSSSYHVDKAGIGQGSKWTVKQLRHYLHQRHVNDRDLWWKIIAIVNLTLIPQISEVPKVNNCFELYGFDILIDKDLKPWLLEVNFSPSLNTDCPADGVKKNMLSDLIDLMEFESDDSLQGRDGLHPQCQGSYRTTRKQSTSQQPFSKSLSLRPQSMVTMLPKINAQMKKRFCMSANDTSEAYHTDDEAEESCQPSNILSCSLSQINTLPASLVSSSTTVNGTYNRLHGKWEQKPPSSHHSTQSHARLKCYNKPWRQNSETLKIQKLGQTKTQTKVGSRAVVGGFHKIYPFNSTTTKSLSPRQMVFETQQMIRANLSDSSAVAPHMSGDLRQRKTATTTIVSPFPAVRC
ncbi:probable tubulin polyglutamylase TTLL2 [Watersipora subatra]|uniref:probable tubulin polyglutamylase TTLL2 n=1 Tax=Watersipora subatra TaxID=2589382 RepID=UPI00355C09DC